MADGSAHRQEEVFRRDYQRVVGVAAGVLGSRDQAEDVAQDVFVSFGRSSVPAAEARGWLCVAAAHTALNLLRSAVVARRGRRPPPRRTTPRLPRKQAVALVLRQAA